MAVQQFELLVEGIDLADDRLVRRLYDRCPDLTASTEPGGLVRIGVDRQARSLTAAIASAIRDVEKLSAGRVLRVEPDDLVFASDIALRVGRTRASVDQLARGVRGPGSFPAPVSHTAGRHALWRWSDVERWFAEHYGYEADEARSATFAAVNGALEARRSLRAHPDPATGRLASSLIAAGGA